MLAAARMVRSERAVRPCLPMTLPRSVGATRSSSTVSSGSATTVTETCAGSSTNTLAISSTSVRISPLCSAIKVPSNMGDPTYKGPATDGSGSGFAAGRGCGLGEQASHTVRELRALGNPVLDAVALQVNAGGAGPRIVRAHNFHEAAVARPLLVDHYHSIIRLFARTHARQADC